MILPILSFGSPVLRKECEDFDENSPLENFKNDTEKRAHKVGHPWNGSR